MQLVPGSTRIVAARGADPFRGIVKWAPAKSLWIGSMTVAALALCPIFFTPGAFLLFLATCAVTLCAGHSVGMHRRLIHGSFQCPLWLEYICVYLGVLVGMAGPIGMILSFAVLSQPPAMAELSPYAHVDAPHVRGYFETRSTGFTLEPLPGGRTRLVARADHILRLDPALYWESIARWAIRQNIERVLHHVQERAEAVAEARERPGASPTAS